MSASVKHAVKQQTQLPKLPHGSRIYAYNHMLTNQVVYSLDRVLDNSVVLKQLSYAGKNSIPRALRKDHWKPFFVVKFGLPHQGLNAYKKLREWRKLHELSWDPKDVPKLELSDAQLRAREEKRTKIEKLGGFRVGGARHFTEWQLRRKRTIMNQKANSVADLAAVLVEQEAKLATWSPERERLHADIMTWLPELITNGAKRKDRMAAINEEVVALEQKVKDAKAESGEKWNQPLASRITNLNRDLKMKRTEYYQISHLPELFDLSPYAQSVTRQKTLQLEALTEENFILHWQQQQLDNQLRKYQVASELSAEQREALEQKLASLLKQLEDQVLVVKDLQAIELSNEATGSEIAGHHADIRQAIQEIHELRSSITVTRSELLRTGEPPEWLKNEELKKRAQVAVDRVLRYKPQLVGFLSRESISASVETFVEAHMLGAPAPAIDAAAGQGTAPVDGAATQTSTAALSAREVRAKAKAAAVARIHQLSSSEETSPSTPTDRSVTLDLTIKGLGPYKQHTTWLSIFPDFFPRYLSTLTSLAPKPTSDIRLSDVSIEWSDPLDAEFGAEWPAEVSHAPMGVVRNIPRSERFAPRMPDADAYAADAQGKPLPATKPALVEELQPRAEAARAKALVDRANVIKRKANLGYARALAEEKARLRRVLDRHVRGPVGKAIRDQAREDLAALEAVGVPRRAEGAELVAARAAVAEQRKIEEGAAAAARAVLARGRYTGAVELGEVRLQA